MTGVQVEQGARRVSGRTGTHVCDTGTRECLAFLTFLRDIQHNSKIRWGLPDNSV